MDRQAVAAIAALDDDVRRALYEHVRTAREPVTREDAATSVGISTKLAAFHLDKLVELGVLRAGVSTARRVGRAPKVYTPVEADLSFRVPARDPELLASILVEAVTTEGAGERAEQAVMRVAGARGAARGAALGAAERERRGDRVAGLLAELGFEPYEERGAVRLRNCPFHPVVGMAPALVCGMNRAYLAGVLEGLDAGHGVSAELAPRAGECCVELRPG